MKPKKILRFYFGADSLERAFDNLIERKAYDFEADTLEVAERLIEVIGDKMKLQRLWGYLDGVISSLYENEREVLLNYSSRTYTPSGDNERRAVRRAVIKFTRHARRIGDFADCISIINKYYCLIKV